MPADKKEIEYAKNEGIHFIFQNNIVKIIGEEKVNKVELIRTQLVCKEGEKGRFLLILKIVIIIWMLILL